MESETVCTLLPLTIKYGNLEEQINAGKYDRKYDNDITAKNFPTDKTGEVRLEAILVHFGKYRSNEEVLREINKLTLRVGDLDELLAIGTNYPDKQREHPIVALGSGVRLYGAHRVPCLHNLDGKRSLILDYGGNGWHGYYCFLAFPK